MSKTAWSNLGQTWSTPVKLGQSSPNSGKCIPGHVLRVFLGIADPSCVKNGLIKSRSNLVNPGQTGSNLRKCVSDLVLRLFDVASPYRIRPT